MKTVIGILAIVLLTAAVPSTTSYVPTDAERARWTMFDMRSWQTALAAYQQDHGKLPEATTLEQVRDAVQPTYIAHVPMTDAWGRSYRFVGNADNGYQLVSSGADGKFDPASWSQSGKTTSFDDDAVVNAKGRWLARYWEMR
jgi:type II secretory pathway pseudopilin PulG